MSVAEIKRHLSMKQVWMTLHSLHSRIVSEVSTYTRPSCGPISARLIRKHCRTCQPSLEKVLGKEPDFLQSDGTDHVYDNTVSSVSSSFPGLELNVNDLQARIGFLRQEYSTKKKLVSKGVLAVKGCMEKFVCQHVHMSLSGGFASDVTSGSDTARDTWQDGEGRECRFVSIDKEMKKNVENFKRDFLLHAAEEI